MSSIVKAAIFSVLLLAVLGLGAFYLMHRPDGGGEQPVTEAAKEAAPVQPATPKVEKPLKAIKAPSADEVTFTVRAVDGVSKAQLPKATLLVQRVTDGDHPGEKVFESGRRIGAAGGEFKVSLSPGAYLLRAQCVGYSAAEKKLTLLKDHAESVVLELSKGFSISGRILTKEGRGIGGGRVMAYPQIGHPKMSMIERLIQITKITDDAQRPPAETVSADDGSYQIDGLERKHYTVKAVAAAHSPAERENILPTADGVDFKLTPGGELTGVVVDGSGSGVDGAKVMAFTHNESADLFEIIQTRSRPPFETVVTGGGGAFKFLTLGAGSYNFLVQAKGFQEEIFTKIKVHEGENPPQRFLITRGLSISGSVVNPQNEPVAGAKVRATRVGESGRSDNMIIRFDDGSILTDEKGLFSFDTLKPGKYTILAWAKNYSSEQRRDVDANTTDLVITLPLGGAIAGLITEAGSGSPVAGARVSVSDLQDLRKEEVSDDKGHYYVGGLSVSGQGKHYLNIHADGYARLSQLQIHVEDGKVTDSQNFELQRTGSVSGRVVNSNGEGVASARVMARRKSGTSPVPLTVGSGVTGEDGRYVIKDVEAGADTALSVLSSDYLEGQSDVFTIDSGQSLELKDVALQLGGMVQGDVVTPEGAPVPGVQISVRKEGETTADPTLGATSDARGAFILKGLTAGSVDLVARSPAFIESEVSGVKVAEGSITKGVRIVLKTGGHIRGVVLDGDGKPVRDAKIVGRDTPESGGIKELAPVESDQDGAFLITGIQAADGIDLSVDHSEYGSWSGEKVAVNTEDLKVVLPKLGGVRGTVVSADGKPVASFSVQPIPKGESGPAAKRLSAKTFQLGPANKDGAFEYAGVPPGVYDISARAPGFSAATKADVEIAGQLVDLGPLVLQDGGTVSGTVVDQQGLPVAGASVRVVGGMVKFANLAPGSGGRSADPAISVTDSQGSFEFHNLKPGTVSLQATAKGYVTQRVEDVDPSLVEKSRDLKVTLNLGAEIFGHVLDAQGNAKSGVTVFLTAIGGASSSSGDQNTRQSTDGEGKYVFKGLPSGTYRVIAQRLAPDTGSNSTAEAAVEAGVRQEIELVFE